MKDLVHDIMFTGPGVNVCLSLLHR